MHLNQIVIKFTPNEKYELQNIISGFKEDPREGTPSDRHKAGQQDLEFKNNIVNFIKAKKTDLQDKGRCIERLRDFLLEEKCIESEQNSIIHSNSNEYLTLGLQNLKIKIAEMAKNNEVFELFIVFLEEMKDLKEERIYEFEYKLSKAAKLSRMERETLALLAKKLVKVDSLSKMGEVEDDLTSFFAKITRYGIHQQFKELERINNQEIKNKCYKLLEYLQNNCIEVKQQFSPVRSLLKKLSISIYDKPEVLASLAELPQNIRLIFEPVCNEIFRLREGAMKTSIIGDTGVLYVSHDMKRAQEQNLESLRREKQQLKKKYATAEEELKRTKIILEKLGHMSNLFRQEDLYETIESELGNSSQQLKIYLERIYNHLKSFEELTLGARKASFIERKDNEIQFLQEKLSVALQELDIMKSSRIEIQEAESLLLDQNSVLQDQTSENQRVIQQYQTEISNLNAQINAYSKEINTLSGELLDSEKQIQLFMRQKSEMQKQIDNIMNLRTNEDADHQNELITINKQLESQLKVLREENYSLLQKCQEKSAEHIELEEKTKQIASLKYLYKENSHLVELIEHLNQEIQRKEKTISQNLPKAQRQDDFAQTSPEQPNTPPETVNVLTNQIKQLKEEKEKLESLKAENDQLKQQRLFRLNEEKEMKRIYREQKADVSQIEDELQRITREYDELRKKYNDLRLHQFERKVHMNSSSTDGTNVDKENLRKMQQKHRLLERNFEEVKKYNDLIKSQYYKLKEETNHIIKSKVKDVIEECRENELKLRKESEQLTAKAAELNAKIAILQEENLNLKVQLQNKPQKNDLSSVRQKEQFLTQSMNFVKHKQQPESQEKLRAELRLTKIKHEHDRIHMLNEIKAREEQISSQRIEILKLEQKIDQLQSKTGKVSNESEEIEETSSFTTIGRQSKSKR